MHYFYINLQGLSHHSCFYTFMIKIFGEIMKFQLSIWILVSNLIVIRSKRYIIYNIYYVSIVYPICL